MLKTAEAVSLGHPDKTADYISSYILDRAIEQDSSVKYAVEVMVKDNTIIFGGEIKGNVDLSNLHNLTLQALAEIGYGEEYAKIWGEYAIEPSKIKTINLIGQQSLEINQGVEQDGWGDQGVFVGYACQGEGLINRELYLARKLNTALYQKALKSQNLGLDIKTQITIDENGNIKTAVAAVPMLVQENLEEFIIEVLGQKPESLIINGTGQYTYHSSIADCGITGRKLACDFYSTACPVGGGSPWTKDASKADLTLNLCARKIAVENLKNNDECFVYLSSCIGRVELPSATIKTIKKGVVTENELSFNKKPSEIIAELGLNKSVFANLCKNGLLANF
ncbi:MAG: methionine adenosyltransferase domain-containing protein [Alphaproteobacteria bacterium]